MYRNPAPRAAIFTLAAFSALALLAAKSGASPTTPPTPLDERGLADPAQRLIAIKRAQRDMLMQGARNHMAEARSLKAWERWTAKHPGFGKQGTHVRRANDSEESAVPLDEGRAAARVSPMSTLSTLAIPTNVRCNNPAGEAAGTGESEESIASLGNNILVAWNDGNGFNTGGDIQNYGYSTDGGVTFIQPAGGIPHPTGNAGRFWASDPLVTVNEKTGEFFYAGLCDSAGGAFSGVGTAKATFPGGGLAPVWSPAHIARKVDATTMFLDKEWMAADSSNGNLYLTYTIFATVLGTVYDSIDVQRSTDGGVTWGPMLTMSSDAAAGFVQGARTAVGPNGEVYSTWEEIGNGTAFDHFKIRKSTNLGVSFAPEVTIADFYSNFGTGAPGFNRQTGISFPSIAVDRSTGPHRGRIYESWNEAVNWFDDPLGGGGKKTEVEPNNTSATASAFTPGMILRGTIANTTDLDYFSFSATSGTTYIFWCDSLNANLQYTMRILCSDGTTRLSLSGADANSPGANGFCVWTAPSSGTYFFRMGYNGSTGGYRVETGVNGPNTGERSRDHRDLFVARSDDGTSWMTPTRVNDDVPRLDDWLPEVSVGGDGNPYVIWYDWRDASGNCFGSSNVYTSRSTDGGATWAANQIITSAASAWTTVSSNIAPNEGDYVTLGNTARVMHPSWADGRSGDPDVWSNALDTGFDITTCENDSSLTTGTTLQLTYSWANKNIVFANDYTYTLTDDVGWVSGTPQAANVAAGGSKSVTYSVNVPNPAAPSNDFYFKVTNANGTLVQSCKATFSVSGNVGVPPTSYIFDLKPAAPNPAVSSTRIDFELPRAGAVKLVVFGLQGEHVRTLVDGVRGAGPNSATWDGRDDQGHRSPAGAYFYQLESLGKRSTRRLVLLP